jgi:hypothetical protein
MGAPDAGLECLWRLPNGDEWGWQAKFFVSAPGADQWRQVDKSVKTALAKHPRLTRCWICLPVDRSDARISGRVSSLQQWDRHVEKWVGWAATANMSVEFEYWGEHELWEMLSRPEHCGRRLFWFGDYDLSSEWFRARFEEARADAGVRYTPELNIELPVAYTFEGLGMTPDFGRASSSHIAEIRKALQRSSKTGASASAEDEYAVLRQSVEAALASFEGVSGAPDDPVDWGRMRESSEASRELARACATRLRALQDAEKAKAASKATGSRGDSSSALSRGLDCEIDALHRLSWRLHELVAYSQDDQTSAASTGAVLLVGDAGTGKTHLLCDVADRRTTAGRPTVLLLGQHFNGNDDPWAQMISRLGLSCDRDSFLGALETAAQAAGSRALILIDALNEGEGRSLWAKHIGGMLNVLRRYPWIGLAVSVRRGYEDLVVPESLPAGQFTRVEHHGFSGAEFEATTAFFEHYGIMYAEIPLLAPEFQNPLFLKLFCDTLRTDGLRSVPGHFTGSSAVFKQFLLGVNGKLARPELLNYDPHRDLVGAAVTALVDRMSKIGTRWLRRDLAGSIVNEIRPSAGYADSFFNHLIQEGVLAEGRFWARGAAGAVDGVQFCYERFSDFLLADRLIDKYCSSPEPEAAFGPAGGLGALMGDDWSCYENSGVIEALATLVPERIGRELPALAPQSAGLDLVKAAFVNSLIWRDRTAFSEETRGCINEYVIPDGQAFRLFIDAMLTVSTDPAHPYNADRLHDILMGYELPQRDALWSTLLHEEWGREGALDRVVGWARGAADKTYLSDQSMRLAGMTLGWFLTTSNRGLRDSSTKALVALFTDRLSVLPDVIEEFLGVNDPYVIERLIAAAYGCAMRTSDRDGVAVLAGKLYGWFFEDNRPPADILLRDYARGVIEVAARDGGAAGIDLVKARPPYTSEWPAVIPSDENLAQHGKYHDGMSDSELAKLHLFDSVMGSGDFARYIIGTNSGAFEWINVPIGEPVPQTSKEMIQEFETELSPEQTRAYHTYRHSRWMGTLSADDLRIILGEDASEPRGLSEPDGAPMPPADEELFGADYMDASEEEFVATLDDGMRVRFEQGVKGALDRDGRDELGFDLAIAQRWIFQRVLELGWTPTLFGRFDRAVAGHDRYGRGETKPERIGKKYQWIAYHEFLARVADHFRMREDSWSDRPVVYEGPWQLSYVRDIDPSVALASTHRDEGFRGHHRAWWFPSSYDITHHDAGKAWLRDRKDLPDPATLLSVERPSDDSQWFVLDGFLNFSKCKEEISADDEYPRRDFWYLIHSYVVRSADMDAVFTWASGVNLYDQRMPETSHLYKVFLGETYWSPAWDYFRSHGREEWTRGWSDKIPAPVLYAADEYFWERGYDCSVTDAITIKVPGNWLARGIGLSWEGREGEFVDAHRRVVAMDPSTRQQGPSALLIRQTDLLEALRREKCELIWVILGEKNLLEESRRKEDWPGRLTISGAYRMGEGELIGRLRPKFITR